MLVMAAQTPRAATADGPRKPEYSVSCTIPLLVLPDAHPTLIKPFCRSPFCEWSAGLAYEGRCGRVAVFPNQRNGPVKLYGQGKIKVAFP